MAARRNLDRALDRAATASRARSSARRRLYRRNLILRFTSDRALPLVIAVIVLAAAGVSLAPPAPVGAAQGAAVAELNDVRLAIGGRADAMIDAEDPGANQGATVDAAAIDDGTIYKPVAVDTSIQSSADMLRHYKVKQGDTITSIASHFGVSMMTVAWANKVTSTDPLKAGRDLIIPPVNGLVITVKAGDTLDSVAAANKISVEDIIATNDLQDPNLIVGQVLVLPGAKGAPLPTATPAPKPAAGRSGGSSCNCPFVPAGGAWAWPVPGGYISQYFHYGHYGVDIAHDYGSAIVAPRDGVVVFAGWKDNGGGYQVWINHGGGIYSGHHHMSAVLVSAGQTVSKGQQIGRIGQSGWATGPHDHFEVWIGKPWESGSYRVNPLRYY